MNLYDTDGIEANFARECKRLPGLTSKSLPALNAAVGKLMDQLTAKQDELRRREQSQGMSHDVRKMNKLREEIASLEKRLARAERLQDEALTN